MSHRSRRLRALLPSCLAAALLIGCGCGRAPAWREGRPLPAVYVLDGITVIDGTGAWPRRDESVVVSGGRIVAVGPRGSLTIPAGAAVIPMRGRYLLPGLIDTHAQVTTLITKPDSTGTARPRYDRAVSEQVLRTMLAYGITTVRNPAAPTAEGVALREDVARGAIPGPRIFTAGRAIVLGSGRTPPHVVAVSGVDEARAAVDRQAAAGVDYVKIYTSVPPPVAKAIIDQAHLERLRVIGHLGRTSWTEAAEMGIDAIAHGAPWTSDCLPPERRAAYRDSVAEWGAMKARIAWLEWLDPSGPEVGRMVDALVRRHVAVDPTLIAYRTKFWNGDSVYAENPANRLVPAIAEEWKLGTSVDDWTPDDFRRARAQWGKLLALVKRYDDAGVLLTTGSDEPNPWVAPGESLHRELRLLASSGLTPLHVISLATRNAARALGIEGIAGTIEAGKRADLLVLDADPLVDIRNTRSIVMVIQGGRRVAGRLATP